ncbi:MAG: lipid-binding SYLF domain-containing protein [Gammaproteobacteria bacterium]|nr:lipid-binding SYLF domain-containing protein [Gammaproteobacteria bacterium]
MTMPRKFSLLAGLLVLFLTPLTVQAQSKEENRINKAITVLDQIMRIRETRVPESLLSKAYAVAVIPGVKKVGLGFGGRYGTGAISVRRADNSWSNPSFVKLAGGSWGLQIGISETDLILVFKNKKGVDGITNGKLTLGADASVAAGPVGRAGSAATDIRFDAEVYSYSRSRGLFIGVALEGVVISIHDKANARFYHRDSVDAGEIIYGDITPPQPAREFMATLAKYAPASGSAIQYGDDEYQATDDNIELSEDDGESSSGVKTFPVYAPEPVPEIDPDADE